MSMELALLMDVIHDSTYGRLQMLMMRLVVTHMFVHAPFVVEDYFCDTGSRYTNQDQFYDQDPLWDGAGCGGTSTCCEFNNPPWFCKQLPEPTADDIELRLCSDESPSNEDVAIEVIELYVQ